MILLTAVGSTAWAQTTASPPAAAPAATPAPATAKTEETVVTIVAKKTTTPSHPGAGQTVVPTATISENPLPPTLNNIVAATVPGAISLPNEAIRIRGSDNQYSYYLDGAPLPANISAFITDQFSPENISRLDVFTGPIPAQFGGQTAGVFDIAAKSGTPGDNHGYVSETFGTHDTEDTSFGYSGGENRLGYFVSGLHNSTNFFLSPITSDPLHNGGREDDGFGKFDYRLGELDRLTLDMGDQQANLQIPNTPARELAGQNDYEIEDKSFFNLIWNHEQTNEKWKVAMFTHDSDVKYQGSPADLTVEPSDPAPADDPLLEVNQKQQIRYSGVRADATFGDSVNHQIQAGLESTVAEGNLTFSLLSEPDSGFGPLLDNRDLSSTDSGGYLQKQYVKGKYDLTYGARFDVHHADDSSSQLSPRVNLAYNANAKNQFQAFYDHLFMPVPVESIRDLQGNTIFGPLTLSPAKPERDDYYGLGWKHELGRGVLNVDPYLKLIKDIVDNQQIGDTLIEVPINEAHGLIRGCDFSYDVPLTQQWHYNLDYGLSRGTAAGPITGGLNGLELLPPGNFPDDHDQESTISSTLNYHHKSDYGLVQYQFDSGLPWGEIDDSNGNPLQIDFNRVPAQSYLNLGYGHHFGHGLDVSLSVDNLFNHDYDIIQDNEFRRSVYGDGRTFMLKTTLGF